MATVKIILRKQKTNKKGDAPLCIRITKNRQSKFIFLDYRIDPEFWNAKKGRVKSGHPNHNYLNNFIAQRLADAEASALAMETGNKHIASREIKTSIKGMAPVNFFQYANSYADSFQNKGKIGTYKRAKSVIQKLSDYMEGKQLYFDQVNVHFLKNYEEYLVGKLKNRANTVHSNFRIIRTVINNAIREDLIPAEINPFPKYKLKVEKTQRAYLTEDELMKIENLNLCEDKIINHHRNLYVFCAYAGGLRISDVLQLRWSNFDGEKINIRIQKTKAPLSIKLPSKSLEILHHYSYTKTCPDDFIFPVINIDKNEISPLAIHTAISRATAYTNKDLKKLSQLAEIEKHISFHTSRHTFATRALRKGIRIEYVSKLMGHAAIKETQGYTQIINSELDNAMSVFN